MHFVIVYRVCTGFVPGISFGLLGEPTRQVCVATRMSSASVYDRQLLLDFAAPRTHASSAANGVRARTVNALPAGKIMSVWHSAQRHRIRRDFPLPGNGIKCQDWVVRFNRKTF